MVVLDEIVTDVVSPEAGIHIPVMVQEVMEFLDPASGRYIVDGTIGGGGHAEAICRLLPENGFLIGLDRDAEAIRLAKQRLRFAEGRYELIHANFQHLDEVLTERGWTPVDGVLLDLGVSTMQVFSPARGFSFDREGPLDMRMDAREPMSAAEIVNTWSQQELEQVLWEGGEMRWARRLARTIVRARQQRPIRTTADLANLILRHIPRGSRKGHPATKAFQAIRIAVNDELRALKNGLAGAFAHLKLGGRLCVISFHSGEDRIVKQTFRQWHREGRGRLLTPKPMSPSSFELTMNPRSRSAKLRAVERCL